MKKGYFDRPISDAIKGIALVLMFIHHFFTFPRWYVVGISFPLLRPFVTGLCAPTKICVSVFAFLTGYFFFLGRDKGYGHSLRKIRDTLVTYWMVYIPFLLLALVLGCGTLGVPEMLREAFGLESQVMTFCWYVYFYCLILLLLPLVDRFSTGKLWWDALIWGLLPMVVFTAARELLTDDVAASVAAAMQDWYPCVLAGYLFARFSLFEDCLEPVASRVTSRWGRVLLWLILAAAACLARALWPRVLLTQASIHGSWLDVTVNMDVLYAPVFLYAMKNLLEQLKSPRLLALLGSIGRESLLMWFLHCLFFNCCKEFTQPLLYWPRLAILVLPWGLALCYAAAKLLHYPLDFLLGKKRTGPRP